MTLSRWDPAFLVVPRAGELEPLLRRVQTIALKRLLAQSAVGLDRPTWHALQRVQAWVIRQVRRDKTRMLEAVGQPDVLPFLLGLQVRRLPASQAIPSLVPNLLAAWSALGSDSEEVRWMRPVTAVCDPLRGRRVRLPTEAAGVVVRGDAWYVVIDRALVDPSRPHAGVVVEEAYVAITPHLHLALWDSNPFSSMEVHPDKEGNALDLAGRPPEVWTEAYAKAVAMIGRTLPAWHAELPAALRRVVPVGYFPELHMSASVKVSPGMAWASLHPSVLTLAEALVHETQHGKLNTLMWSDPVLRNGATVWTESPVRPDLRPLMGVLLAVHAFVPVALLHRALLEDDDPFCETGHFQRRYLEVLAGNRRGLELLDELADPTPIGQRVLEGLRRLHEVSMEGAPPLPERLREALPPG